MSQEPEQITWFLRTSAESVHGELTLDTLRQWAESGRILAENEISRDGKTWILASDVPELKMDWVVTLRSGIIHGPLNLLSVPSIYRRGIIDNEAILENRTSKQKIPAASLLRGLSNSPAYPDTSGSLVDPAKEALNPARKRNEASDARTVMDVDEPRATPPVGSKSISSLDMPTNPPSVGPLISGRSSTSFVRPVRTPPTKVSPLLGRRPDSVGEDSMPDGSIRPNRKNVPPPGEVKSVPIPSETPGDSSAELKARTAETVQLRQEIQELTNKNVSLKTRLAGAPLGTATEDISVDEIHRRLKAEVHQLRQQMHVSDVRAETAETRYLEQCAALRKAQDELTALKQAQTPRASGAMPQMSSQSDTLRAHVGELGTLLHASTVDLLSRLEQSEIVRKKFEASVQALSGNSNDLDSLADEIYETIKALHSAFAAEREQWEGAELMAQNKKVNFTQIDHSVDESLRRRIALLEATLSEYKNKEAGTARVLAPVDENAVAKIAEEKMSTLRTELQTVISALRKDNARLLSELASVNTQKNISNDVAREVDSVKCAHVEEITALKASYAVEKASLERALKETRAQAGEAPGPATGDIDGGRKIVNL